MPVKQRAPQPARPSPQFTHPVEILVQAGRLRPLHVTFGDFEPGLMPPGNGHRQRVGLPDLREQGARGSQLPQAGRLQVQQRSVFWFCRGGGGRIGSLFRLARLSTATTINKTVHFSSISVYMGQGGSGPA